MKTAITAVFIALITFGASAAHAATEAELRKRFEERYPEIRKLKQAGTIGETSEGYVEFVKEKEKDAADVVKDENDDRRELYRLIADKEKVDPEVVAQRNAKRNFDRARDGEYLKEDGKWRKKGESSQ